MKKRLATTLVVSAALVAAFAWALRSGRMPLGVRGEWEWLRPRNEPTAVDVVVAGLGVAAFAIIAGFGMKTMRSGATIRREALAVVALFAASVVAQVVVHSGAPDGYGLAKWVMAPHHRGSAGYFSAAKKDVHDIRGFLVEYPTWIRHQDALHIGTHPPGLIVFEALVLRGFEGSPSSSRFVVRHVPEQVDRALRIYGQDNPMTLADRATLVLTGVLTLVACAATVVPIYVLARSRLSPELSWATAALWPLVPSAILFQPTPDTAFPLLSTTALALAAHAGGLSAPRRRALAFLAGVALAIGMQFSLVFLPVGLIVAIVLLGDSRSSRREKQASVMATGFGFLVVTITIWVATGANPFVIWWWNQRNHARFYAEFPRSYAAWVVANPVELCVGLGLPIVVWAFASFVSRDAPRVSVATAVVLAILTLSGRSLSEVGRLWVPFMPAMLLASGEAIGRLGAGPKSLAATIALVGAETLVLEATIQVVYPV